MKAFISICIGLLVQINTFAQSDVASYPNKPVRLIVTTAAGGGSDAIARPLEAKFSEFLGQQVIIDNRPGASGMIAMELAARAQPDGYTIVFATVGTLASNYALHEKITYNPIKDYEPVTKVAETYLTLIVNPKLGVNSVQEFVALAKSREKTNPLTFASYGVGSFAQLVTEWFSSIANIKMIHVPYKGSAPAMTDLIGGQVDCFIDTLPSAMPFIRSKQVKALAVGMDKRGDGPLADIPTFAQSGFPEFQPKAWWGILAPANTPKPIVAKLNSALTKALSNPEVRARFTTAMATPIGNSPDEFRKQIKDEVDTYVRVAKQANIKAD
jgi:tripartite-type tricarboxylate transporter receptor subunit TctC